jgi:hypothetical protein
MFRRSEEGKVDLWGVELPRSHARELKEMVNDPRWAEFMETWLTGLIAVYRAKLDTCRQDELLEIQANIRAVKKLCDMRESFRGRTV